MKQKFKVKLMDEVEEFLDSLNQKIRKKNRLQYAKGASCQQ